MKPRRLILPEEAISTRVRSRNRFYWLAIVWLIGYLGIIAKQAVAQGDTLHGIQDGVIFGAIASWFMLILTVPLGLIGRAIASWKPLHPHRIWISLLLPVFFSFADVVGVAVDRIHPHRRFEQATGVRFPADATVLSCSFENWGMAFSDATHLFQFTCSPAETERLIRELKLRKNRNPGGGSSRFPRSRGWTVEERWTSGDMERRGVDYIELETDASRTRVRVVLSWV
jgi:hypothetical protein